MSAARWVSERRSGSALHLGVGVTLGVGGDALRRRHARRREALGEECSGPPHTSLPGRPVDPLGVEPGPGTSWPSTGCAERRWSRRGTGDRRHRSQREGPGDVRSGGTRAPGPRERLRGRRHRQHGTARVLHVRRHPGAGGRVDRHGRRRFDRSATTPETVAWSSPPVRRAARGDREHEKSLDTPPATVGTSAPARAAPPTLADITRGRRSSRTISTRPGLSRWTTGADLAGPGDGPPGGEPHTTVARVERLVPPTGEVRGGAVRLDRGHQHVARAVPLGSRVVA